MKTSRIDYSVYGESVLGDSALLLPLKLRIVLLRAKVYLTLFDNGTILYF